MRRLRFLLTVFRQSPWIATIAVISLGIGIGAGATVFSAVNALLLKDLPVASADRLVRASVRYAGERSASTTFTFPTFQSFRDHARSVQIIGIERSQVGLSQATLRQQVGIELVTDDYFKTLAISTTGNGFTPSATREAVLSGSLAMQLFGSATAALGKEIHLNDLAFNIVSVAPDAFHGTNFALRTDVWLPLAARSELLTARDWQRDTEHPFLQLLGRLDRGVDARQASAELTDLLNQARSDAVVGRSVVSVLRERESRLNPSMPEAVTISRVAAFALIGLVVAVAAANVAALLLARTLARSREIGVRLALGASRASLIREIMAEGLVLALPAAGIGLLLAQWGTQIYRVLLPPVGVPLALDFAPDAGVMLVTIGLAVTSGLLAALVPAIRSSRGDLLPLLNAGGRAGVGSVGFLNGLLAVQFSIATLILIVAGLFLQTMTTYQRTDPGFQVNDGFVIQLQDLASLGYSEAGGRSLYHRLIDELRRLPGVQSVSLAQRVVLSPSPEKIEVFADTADAIKVGYNTVGENYFKTLGIPLRYGREFQDLTGGSPNRVVINETMAHQFWPGSNPVGKTIRLPDGVAEVIGVAADLKYACLRCDPEPYLYRSLSTSYESRVALHVKGRLDPELIHAVTQSLDSVDNRLLSNVLTLRDVVSADLWLSRTAALLGASVSVIALLLAAVGLYGVTAFAVAQRTREIGIRMALGASPGRIIKMMLEASGRITGVGIISGVALALFAGRGLSSLLFGVNPADPIIFATVLIVLCAIVAVATIVPARRAATIQPLEALRKP